MPKRPLAARAERPLPVVPGRTDAVAPGRADAVRNRAKLLLAAEEVFTERGAGASLEDVARRAGVGIGTLYRHFPTREALLAAACEARLLELVERSRGHAERERAPAEALRHFLSELVRHASAYRGLAASLGVVLQNGSPACHATTEEGRRLLQRAQKARAIRRDVDFDDIVCMATAISLAAQETPNPRRIDRLVDMFVDGLSTSPRREQE